MGRIEELTGLKRSETQIHKFLISSGLKRRKVGMVPAKADIEKQEIFKKQELEPRLKEAVQGKRKIFLQMQAILSLLLFWAICGR